jgi:hypothetical protein
MVARIPRVSGFSIRLDLPPSVISKKTLQTKVLALEPLVNLFTESE